MTAGHEVIHENHLPGFLGTVLNPGAMHGKVDFESDTPLEAQRQRKLRLALRSASLHGQEKRNDRASKLHAKPARHAIGGTAVEAPGAADRLRDGHDRPGAHWAVGVALYQRTDNPGRSEVPTQDPAIKKRTAALLPAPEDRVAGLDEEIAREVALDPRTGAGPGSRARRSQRGADGARAARAKRWPRDWRGKAIVTEWKAQGRGGRLPAGDAMKEEMEHGIDPHARTVPPERLSSF